MALQLFKDERVSGGTLVNISRDEEESFSGIRCPQCHWRPSASSRWCCECAGTPEPRFDACGAEWNTFSTRGRCPGCAHQWRWTSCLRCGQWSLHDEWYETEETR
jgi:hypothetical protein